MLYFQTWSCGHAPHREAAGQGWISQRSWLRWCRGAGGCYWLLRLDASHQGAQQAGGRRRGGREEGGLKEGGRKERARMSRGAPLKGWRFGAFVGSIVGAIGLAIYPIIIR